MMRAGITAAQFPFINQITEAGRRELGAHSSQHVGPGQLLLKRGDPVDGAYLLVGGSLRVFYITAEGREATLYWIEPGGTCILALTSTFNRQVYPAWVESGPQGASFVGLPNEPFRRLFDGEAAFRDFIFGVLSGRIFALMQTLEEVGSARIEQRVARFLLKGARSDAAVRASQARIASELGTAREVVFRALRSLAARGLIETGRAQVKILDKNKLAQVAEEELQEA